MPRADAVPRGPWLLAALGLGVLAIGLGPRALTPAAPRCDRIARVGEVVACDEDLEAVADACGTVHALRSGDALEPLACTPPSRMAPEDLAALAVRLDPNHDDAAALQSLPGVGPVLAERIVAGRPYAQVDALLRVEGIGPVTLARIRPRLVLADPRP